MIRIDLAERLLRSLPYFGDRFSIFREFGGLSTIVYKVTTDNGRGFYLRIPKNKEESVKSEVLIHEELLKLGVRVPKVIDHQDFSKILDGHSFILTDSMDGKSCQDFMPEKEIVDILSRAAEDLSIINNLEGRGFGPVYESTSYPKKHLCGPYSNYKDFILNRIDQNLKILLDSGHFTSSEIKDVVNVLDSDIIKAHLSYFTQGYLAHGDFRTAHIFHKNNHYEGIIDFGDAKIAPKGYDLAYFKVRCPQHFKHFNKTYTSASNLTIAKTDFSCLTLLISIRVVASELENNYFANYQNILCGILRNELEDFKKLHSIS